MNFDELKSDLPKIASKLAEMMGNDGLSALEEMGLTFEDVEPSVSITFEPKDGGDLFKISLSISTIDENDADPHSEE